MAKVGTTLAVGGVIALLGYAVLSQHEGSSKNPPNQGGDDKVKVVVKATFYGAGAYGQGNQASPFVTIHNGVVVETFWPKGPNFAYTLDDVVRGTIITVIAAPGQGVNNEARQGCSIFVNGVRRSGPPENAEKKPVISPEFQGGSHAANCTAVAS